VKQTVSEIGQLISISNILHCGYKICVNAVIAVITDKLKYFSPVVEKIQSLKMLLHRQFVLFHPHFELFLSL
jgi:hypothetical protein